MRGLGCSLCERRPNQSINSTGCRMVFSRRSILRSGAAVLGLAIVSRDNAVRAETVPNDDVKVHCLVCCRRPCVPICVEASGPDLGKAIGNLIEKVIRDYPDCWVGPAEVGGCEKFLVEKVCPCGRWTAVARCSKKGQVPVEVEASGRTRIAAKRLALEKLRAALLSWGYDQDCCGGCVSVKFERNCH